MGVFGRTVFPLRHSALLWCDRQRQVIFRLNILEGIKDGTLEPAKLPVEAENRRGNPRLGKDNNGHASLTPYSGA